MLEDSGLVWILVRNEPMANFSVEGVVVALTLLAGVAVHVGLEGTWSCESLVAHFAFVLLLGAGGDLGAELTHHRLRCRGHMGSHQAMRAW